MKKFTERIERMQDLFRRIAKSFPDKMAGFHRGLLFFSFNQPFAAPSVLDTGVICMCTKNINIMRVIAENVFAI